MLEELLRQLFTKLEQEPNNDKKSKNGNAVYFIEKVLEERFKKFNLISTRGLKDYYDKYVNGKENASGEPTTELKNLISQYLGYDHFLDFENKRKETDPSLTKIKATSTNKKLGINVHSIKKLGIPTMIIAFLLFGTRLTDVFKSDDCIVWKIDHYEKIDCKNRSEKVSINNVDIERFRKIEVDTTTLFFIKNEAVVWYGKSASGTLDYFSSRGKHPITSKELKPITQYIIHKYIDTIEKEH